MIFMALHNLIKSSVTPDCFLYEPTYTQKQSDLNQLTSQPAKPTRPVRTAGPTRPVRPAPTKIIIYFGAPCMYFLLSLLL